MAAIWRRAAYLSFVRGCSRFLLKQPVGRKSSKWTNYMYTSIASLAVGCGLCAVPFHQVDSHESLVKRAASLVTDSSSTFLSQTTLALINAIHEYTKAVQTLVSLQRKYLASLGKLTPAQEDSIWQVIIGQRAEVTDRQDACRHFESIWNAAVKLCETSAEAACVSGAEQASTTVKTNIQVAQSQVEEALKISLDAETRLNEMKVMEIKRMTQYAATLQKSNDEEEIPEAYLRED